MTTTSDSPRRGAIRRWHPLALVVALLFACAFALANIPGNPVIGWDVMGVGQYGPHFECGIHHMEHGWPITFLSHDPSFSGTAWTLSAWQVGPNPDFRPASLAADMFLGLLGSIAAGWLINRRIRSHGFRFSIRAALVLTVCVALAIGYLTHRRHVHRTQIAVLEKAGATKEGLEYAEWQPFGPYWLRELTGDGFWSWGDWLVAVDVDHSDDIAGIPAKRNIKVLRMFTVRCETMPELKDFPNLLAIDMFMINYDYSAMEDNRDPEFWRCLKVISDCESIQGLNLYEAGVTNRGLKELRAMPNLKNLELSGNPDINDDGLTHLASINSLRRLGLEGTAVSDEGIKALQRALPDCKIEFPR